MAGGQDDLVGRFDGYLSDRAAPRTELLSPRELEVARYQAEGLSDKHIALVLGISYHTVRTHSRAIRSKTAAKTRAHALVILVRQGRI
jgi:LuxR family transcriptional regulator